jgi:LCP family protein required for cell wall assembly
MLSIPRDLYVKIPATGKYQTQYSKINAANSYGGPELAKKVVEGVIGVPIHYYIQADFSGFKQAVDAVGGVDVDVAKTLSDPKYPCDDGTKYANLYCPILFKAGPQHLVGAQALKYSRSRETTSDFDRAARQQQVLVALRQKSLQASTLTNPVKLTGLLDAVGDHMKTDLQLEEIKKLAGIAKDVDTTKITNKVLDTGKPDSLLLDGSGQIAGAGSIELPKAGNFNYADIQDFVKNIFIDHYITDENARVEVQNGSGITGLAGTVAASLKAAHYNVLDPSNAESIYAHTVIYDYTNGKKPYTINYLERRFGVKSQKATSPQASPSPTPATAGSAAGVTPEIRIILGSDYKRASTQN